MVDYWYSAVGTVGTRESWMMSMIVGKCTREVQGIVVVSSPMWLVVGEYKSMGDVEYILGIDVGILCEGSCRDKGKYNKIAHNLK